VDRPPDILASRAVPATAEAIFAFLSDLENHWLIADRFVDVVSLEGPQGARHGGRVRIRGPLGIRRTAETRVIATEPTHRLWGRADLGRGTSAEVSWRLTPTRQETEVELAASVESAGPVDRAMLALGGRRWLALRFRAALDRLAEMIGA
jgi:uncharacterized protein YndB with AHSA1/START domain